MMILSEEQLNNLNKDALVIIVSSLQDQLSGMQKQLDTANAQLSDTNRQIELLTEQIKLMNQRKFGKSSESNCVQLEGQLNMFETFNEIEATSDPNSKEPVSVEEVVISSYSRAKRKGKREEDLDGLPARIFEHTLSKEELDEAFPEGYKELPYDTYKRLHIIPETFIVDEHHVHIYASKSNTGKIIKANRPVDLFRNSIATPALVASIINGKYVNAIPIDRQSRSCKCNGINLSSNTMANWVIKASEEYLSLVYDRMHQLIYNNTVIHADETPVKVMRIDNNKIKNGKKTYMWVYRSDTKNTSNPVILYDWQPSRKADHPREFLKDYSGVVVTDGYEVYHKLSRERKDLSIAGCWVHARRKFAEYIKSIGESNAKGTVAAEAYNLITEIMHLDNDYDDLSKDERLNQRQQVLQPKVDAYFEWVKHKYTQVAHNSIIGKALAYSIHQEEYLRLFLTNGDIPMDNNAALSIGYYYPHLFCQSA